MRTLTIALLFFITLNGFSQDKERKEHIKALKVAFLTEQLELTKAEAEKFWPVYNAFDEQEHKLRKEIYGKHKNLDIKSISEDESKKIIEDMISNENKKHELQQNFIKELQKILPSKKIIKLKMAEDEFNKKMFEEFKKRRDTRKE